MTEGIAAQPEHDPEEPIRDVLRDLMSDVELAQKAFTEAVHERQKAGDALRRFVQSIRDALEIDTDVPVRVRLSEDGPMVNLFSDGRAEYWQAYTLPKTRGELSEALFEACDDREET